MPNKYYSNINGKHSAPKPPGDKAGHTVSYPGESTRNWKKDIGPVGERRNKAGFKEVKQSMAQHMADDMGQYLPVPGEGEVIPVPDLVTPPPQGMMPMPMPPVFRPPIPMPPMAANRAAYAQRRRDLFRRSSPRSGR